MTAAHQEARKELLKKARGAKAFFGEESAEATAASAAVASAEAGFKRHAKALEAAIAVLEAEQA